MQDDIAAAHDAEMEQAIEGTRSMAQTVASFYKTLRDEGLDADEALDLTQTWIAEMVRTQAYLRQDVL